MVSMVVVQMDDVMAKAVVVGAVCRGSDREVTRNGEACFVMRVENEELVGSIAIVDTRSSSGSQMARWWFALIMMLWAQCCMFGLGCVGLDLTV